ncbi:MAG: ATP-binding cassette domain-containing protein [Rivihabitans pingtungensis]
MSTPALHIAGLSHRYGARLALDGVSLNVAPGEFRVLLGPNGAGKSTLYGLLTRLLACQSGAIELFGQPLSAPAMAGGVVFQQPTLDLDLTVEQNLAYLPRCMACAAASGARASTPNCSAWRWSSAGASGCAPAWRPPPPGGNAAPC